MSSSSSSSSSSTANGGRKQGPSGTGSKGARRRRYKAKHADGGLEVRNEINVTPLVDVCLVLLIIFMVITPLLSRGRQVSLAETQNHKTEDDNTQPLIVVTKESEIYYEDDLVGPVTDPRSIDKMKKLVREDRRMAREKIKTGEATVGSDSRITVKADKNVNYASVYPVLKALHEMKVSSIELGTNKVIESTLGKAE